MVHVVGMVISADGTFLCPGARFFRVDGMWGKVNFSKERDKMKIRSAWLALVLATGADSLPRVTYLIPGVAVAGRASLSAIGLVVGAGWAVPAGAEGQGGKENQETQVSHSLSKANLERRAMGSQRANNLSEHGGFAVVKFDDRIELHAMIPGISLGPKGLTDGKRTVSPLELKPAQIIWFARPFDMQAAGKNILVCTNQLLPRIAPTGLENFCGVISNSGSVLFQFPVKQRVPNTLAGIVGLNEDGNYAEIFVGRKVGGEDGAMAGEAYEILAWRYPDKLTRIPGPYDAKGKPRKPGAETSDILQDFRLRAKQN